MTADRLTEWTRFVVRYSEEMQTAERYLQAAIDDALALSSPFSSPAAPEEEQAPPPRRLHGAVIVNPANDAVGGDIHLTRDALRSTLSSRQHSTYANNR